MLVPDSAITGASGRVHAMWIRARGSDAAAIAVYAVSDEASGAGYLQLDPTPPTPSRDVVLVPYYGIEQTWFEKNPLRDPIYVEIAYPAGKDSTRSITDKDVCAVQRVAFMRFPGAGSVTPDTAVGELLEVNDQDACFAMTNWTLGDGAGARHIRATLVPGAGFKSKSQPVQVAAIARALPRIIGGFFYTGNEPYYGVKGGKERTVRIERTVSDGSKVVYDSTYTTAQAVDTVDSNWTSGVFAGISLAVPINKTTRHGLSVTAGVDLGSPRDDWFLGLSVLRTLFGISTEALPVDFHVLGHWGRNRVLKDIESCISGIDCTTDNKTSFQGWGFILSADATSVISELIKKLVP